MTRRKDSTMTKNPLTERLTRELLNDGLIANPIAKAERYIVELDANADPFARR